MPPWIILKQLADAACAKSARSSNATERPRSAASQAAAAPKIPPPTMTRSYSLDASSERFRCTGTDSGGRGYRHRVVSACDAAARVALGLSRRTRRPRHRFECAGQRDRELPALELREEGGRSRLGDPARLR